MYVQYISIVEQFLLHLSHELRNLNATMRQVTEKALLLSPPGGLFDMTAVRNFFPDVSEGACKVLVHRAVSGTIFGNEAGMVLR